MTDFGELWANFLNKIVPKSSGRYLSEKYTQRHKNAPKRRNFTQSGTDVMILKNFAQKIGEKIGNLFSKQSKVMQKFNHNIGFREKCHFFRRKLTKIVIITSTPGHTG
jgi:hypothetical protein